MSVCKAQSPFSNATIQKAAHSIHSHANVRIHKCGRSLCSKIENRFSFVSSRSHQAFPHKWFTESTVWHVRKAFPCKCCSMNRKMWYYNAHFTDWFSAERCFCSCLSFYARASALQISWVFDSFSISPFLLALSSFMADIKTFHIISMEFCIGCCCCCCCFHGCCYWHY